MKDFFAGTGIQIQQTEAASAQDIQAARAAAEDDLDRAAATSIRHERMGEVAEFDETRRLSVQSGDATSAASGNATAAKGKKLSKAATAAAESAAAAAAEAAADKQETAEVEASLRKLWKGDTNAIVALENSLRPVDRYALRFREDVEPIWTKEAAEEWRQRELSNAGQREWDMEELQRRKAEMEAEADDSADMVLAAPTRKGSSALDRKRVYFRERAEIELAQKKRRMAGEDWEVHTDASVGSGKRSSSTTRKYWYNTHTHACTWDKPRVLTLRDGYKASMKGLFKTCPSALLCYIYTFLAVQPDMLSARSSCLHWLQVADQRSLWLRVLTPRGFASRKRVLEGRGRPGDELLEWGKSWAERDGFADNGWGVGPKDPSVVSLHKYTMQGRVFGSLADALRSAHSGQTICLAPGKHSTRTVGPAESAEIVSSSSSPLKNTTVVRIPVRIIGGDGMGDQGGIATGSRGAYQVLGGGYSPEAQAKGAKQGSKKNAQYVCSLLSDGPIEIACKGKVHIYGVNVCAVDGADRKKNSSKQMAAASFMSSSSASSSAPHHSCLVVSKGALHAERCTFSAGTSASTGRAAPCVAIKSTAAKVTLFASDIIDASGAGVSVAEKCSVRVTECAVSGAVGHGIDVAPTATVALLKNEIFGNGCAGVWLPKGSHATLSNNYVHDNAGGVILDERDPEEKGSNEEDEENSSGEEEGEDSSEEESSEEDSSEEGGGGGGGGGDDDDDDDKEEGEEGEEQKSTKKGTGEAGKGKRKAGKRAHPAAAAGKPPVKRRKKEAAAAAGSTH